MDDLLQCYKLGLQTAYEIGLELDLPEAFLKNAIAYFKTQLGEHYKYKGYEVVFPIRLIKIGTGKTM